MDFNRDNCNDDDGDDGDRVFMIDMHELRDLALACIVARLSLVGVLEKDALSLADKAIERLCDETPEIMERMARVCSNAARAGRSDRHLKICAMAEFANGGVKIADDLARPFIARRN